MPFAPNVASFLILPPVPGSFRPRPGGPSRKDPDVDPEELTDVADSLAERSNVGILAARDERGRNEVG